MAERPRTVTVRHIGNISQNVVPLLTGISPRQASPLRILALIRGQWSSEMSLHSVRDVPFHDDRSRLRSGHAPQILVAFRTLVCPLLYSSDFFQIAVSRPSFSAHPACAFALLLREGAQQSFTSPDGGGRLCTSPGREEVENDGE